MCIEKPIGFNNQGHSFADLHLDTELISNQSEPTEQ